jgi:Holliday junction resolvase
MTTAQQLLAKGAGKQPESAILNQIRDYLRMKQWYVVRFQQGIGCHKGIADLCAMRNGRTVWIECKTAKGKLSIHQQAFQEALEEHRCEYVVWRSLEDVLAWEKQAKP